MKRVCNIDWLEVYCFEDFENYPTNAEYYTKKGYEVRIRDYGTPQYSEMFTVYEDGQPFVEIRRHPYSTRENGGIFEYNSCHIRLANCACYKKNPINRLRAFLLAHGYMYKSISRIDICLDFQQFDGSVSVEDFCLDYMRGKYSKVNQNRLHCHGVDQWNGRFMNSFKWGANRSPNNTKLYNKSMELKECGDKPYIRDVWEQAGFDMGRNVWRIEFSMTSQFQNLKNLKNGEIVKKDLTSYDTPFKLLYQFFVMYNRYFDFRKVEFTEDGGYKRKYECERVTLIRPNLKEDVCFVPCRPPKMNAEPGRTVKTLIKKLEEISTDGNIDAATRKACCILISYFIFNSQFDVKFERYRKWDVVGFTSAVQKACEKELEEAPQWLQELNPLLFPVSVRRDKREQGEQCRVEAEAWQTKLSVLLEDVGFGVVPPF